MKAGIIVDGGPHVGLGHLTRCLGLAQALQRFHHLTVHFCVNDPGSRQWVKQHGFLACSTNGQRWDLAIVDSYRMTDQAMHRLRHRSKVLMVLDDFGHTRVHCDWILNGSMMAHEISYEQSHATGWLIGPKFHLMRDEFWGSRKRRKINNEINDMLITFGGGDVGNYLSEIVPLSREVLPKTRFHIVLGPLSNASFALLDKNIKVHRAPDHLRSLMDLCDAAVSAGGQTLFELAAVGLPTLAIPLVSNQIPNVKSFNSVGTALSAGLPKDKRFYRQFKKCLFNLAHDKHLRTKMSRLGPSFIDGLGALRVADAISK